MVWLMSCNKWHGTAYVNAYKDTLSITTSLKDSVLIMLNICCFSTKNLTTIQTHVKCIQNHTYLI